MADTSFQDLLNAVRAWLKLTTGLTDETVIPANSPGPRPTPPFLTVRLVVPDMQLGTDVEFNDDSDPPQAYVEGAREDTVSINAWGRGAGELLRDALLDLRKPSVFTLLQAQGVNIVRVGGMNNLSALLDTDIEERFQADVYVRYRVTSGAEAVVEATSAQAEADVGTIATFTFDLP